MNCAQRHNIFAHTFRKQKWLLAFFEQHQLAIGIYLRNGIKLWRKIHRIKCHRGAYAQMVFIEKKKNYVFQSSILGHTWLPYQRTYDIRIRYYTLPSLDVCILDLVYLFVIQHNSHIKSNTFNSPFIYDSQWVRNEKKNVYEFIVNFGEVVCVCVQQRKAKTTKKRSFLSMSCLCYFVCAFFFRTSLRLKSKTNIFVVQNATV